ncbi:GNAT family N-acetyltransferase [Peribacillus deserti]|uniref:GNAT family N-acetyltransferase n=1 Tax=Peribacillus deserti TaxID=673318 RepID=A0A2N5M290_9BACI|nr:GNAT family N-acetyltransferase [Peribacillus deserti]PLT28494.1 GNAT family N-acetyltransferase [Peribacillus deserti]
MKVKVVETEQELQLAYSIRKEVFVEEQNVPLEEEIDQYEKDSTHFLLYINDKPAGAGRFRILNGIGKVERICVLSSAREKGAGKAIMDGIQEYAEKHKISKLKLNAQTHAIPFYEKLGYEVSSGEFMDAGIPHKSMVKTL